MNWDATPEAAEPPHEDSHHITRDDVVWRNVEHCFDDESDVVLQPIDPQVEENRLAMRESYLTVGVVYDDEDDQASKYQFSIRDILILNTILALLLALTQWFAPGGLAGALGITTVLAAILMVIFEPENRRVSQAWWGMFLIYIAACIFAIYH